MSILISKFEKYPNTSIVMRTKVGLSFQGFMLLQGSYSIIPLTPMGRDSSGGCIQRNLLAGPWGPPSPLWWSVIFAWRQRLGLSWLSGWATYKVSSCTLALLCGLPKELGSGRFFSSRPFRLNHILLYGWLNGPCLPLASPYVSKAMQRGFTSCNITWDFSPAGPGPRPLHGPAQGWAIACILLSICLYIPYSFCLYYV